MSFWGNITSPVNNVLNSNYFKAAFPVQALAQGLVQGGTKLAHIGGEEGLNPANQYAVGAAGGSLLGGGSALMSGAGGSGGAAPSSAAAPPWQQALLHMRALPGQGGPQQQQTPPPNVLAQIYTMYPQLRPHSGGM